MVHEFSSAYTTRGCMNYAWFHIIDLLVLIHSLYIYGRRWTSILFALGFSFGLFSEHLGASYGWIFGKFHYQPDRIMIFGTVPVLTPVAWWIIIYCVYNTTNLIFSDFRLFKGKGHRIPLALFLMASLDGLMAMSLDMLLDPIMVCPERKRWVWEFGGAYFNIPIQNFVGWFLVVFTVSLLIRIYDVRKGCFVRLGDHIIHFLPTGVYFCMFAFFALVSYVDGNPQYALIGFSGMMPFVLWASLRGLSTLKASSSRRETGE
jgi:putative membrane protein